VSRFRGGRDLELHKGLDIFVIDGTSSISIRRNERTRRVSS